jgi:hypothetical protein
VRLDDWYEAQDQVGNDTLKNYNVQTLALRLDEPRILECKSVIVISKLATAIIK